MKEEDEKNVYSVFELKKATYDVKEIKEEIKAINKDDRQRDEKINAVEKKVALMEQKLNTIINNTEKTNTIIQQAIFGAIATAVIGGIIAIVWAQIGGAV